MRTDGPSLALPNGPAGNVITATDSLGHQTVYGYDAADERTSVRHADGGIAWTAYDLDGRIVARTDPLAHTTTDAYDSLGRLTSVTDPLVLQRHLREMLKSTLRIAVLCLAHCATTVIIS